MALSLQILEKTLSTILHRNLVLQVEMMAINRECGVELRAVRRGECAKGDTGTKKGYSSYPQGINL